MYDKALLCDIVKTLIRQLLHLFLNLLDLMAQPDPDRNPKFIFPLGATIFDFYDLFRFPAEIFFVRVHSLIPSTLLPFSSNHSWVSWQYDHPQ
jgi:hypothetical protein